MRWLQGIWPVLAYAQGIAGLPLDIVVQPQPTPGAAPLALAFVDGRCKLVLSMRGNPEAQATLDRIEPALLDRDARADGRARTGPLPALPAMARWYGLPAGLRRQRSRDDRPRAASRPTSTCRRRAAKRATATSSAWPGRSASHPQHYAALHAWLLAERSRERIPRSHHDTLAWVRLARTGVRGGRCAGEAVDLRRRGRAVAGRARRRATDRRRARRAQLQRGVSAPVAHCAALRNRPARAPRI